MSRISVVMTHYNNAIYLADAVRSILDQLFSDVSLYLVDDNSPNNDWLDSIQDFLLDARFHIYQSNVNVGTYRLKNAMLEMIDSEYIAFHDSDDISEPDRLLKQNDYLSNHKEVVLLGGAFYEVDEQGRRSSTYMPYKPLVEFNDGGRYLSLHPTWCIRSKLLEELVGFDGKTRIAADDEFLYRALYSGEVRNLSDYIYTKRIHSKSLTASSDTGFGSSMRIEYSRFIERQIMVLKNKKKDNNRQYLKARENNIDFKLSKLN